MSVPVDVSITIASMIPYSPGIAIASVCYLIFNRWEPRNPWYLAALLLVLPPLVQRTTNNHSSLFVAYVLHFATIVVLTLAYRLSPFHPLAKYPGPRIAAATKLWLTIISRGGKQHLFYQKLHEQYGDIVRTGPDELSFIDPKYIGPMMGANGMPKGPYWDGRLRGTPFKGLAGIRDPVEHSKRRQRWQRAFTTQALQGYEIIVEKRSMQLLDCLSKHVGESLDLMDWINRYTFDFMMDMTFDGGSEMLTDGDPNGVWHVLEKAQPDTLFIAHSPWLAEFTVRMKWLNSGIKACRDLAMNRGIERKEKGAMNRDIMHYLLDEEGLEETPPSLPLVLSDALTAFLAGADTTATTLSCLFYFLMRYPDKYRRLQEEADSTTGYAFDTATNANMVYLNAVINESLRLFPAVPSGSQRAPVVGSGGHMLGEHFIPEGTSAIVHTYTMQRDPRNFSSPNSFIPERWLPTDSPYSIHHDNKANEGFKHNPMAFIPFSYGPANCVGKQLAWQEMRAVVRLMIEKFDMKFADGYDWRNWEKDFLDYYITIKGRLPVVLEARSEI